MSTQRETLQQKARIFALLVVAIFGGGAAFAAISDWLQWSDVVVLTGFSVALLGWIVPFAWLYFQVRCVKCNRNLWTFVVGFVPGYPRKMQPNHCPHCGVHLDESGKL